MIDRDTIESIRSIFLHPEPRVTIAHAALLLCRPYAEVEAAVRAGDIEASKTRTGTWIDAREVAEQAVQQWPMLVIEEALGDEAAMVLPAGLRSAELTVRMPSFLVDSVRVLADEKGESEDAVVARELHDLADTCRDRLSPRIASFDECIDWPSARNVSGEAPPFASR